MSFTNLAYFDPGAGSLILQLLIGGIPGIWMAARYLIQRWIVKPNGNKQ